MATEISKQNRVLYLNTPLDYLTRMKGNINPSHTYRLEVLNGNAPLIRQINDNLWIVDCPIPIFPLNKLPTAWLFDFVNKINNKRIARRINEVMKQFDFQRVIHIADNDIYRSFYLKELIQPALSIYYCRDFLFYNPYWRKNGSRLEPLLAAKADMVVTNSPLLAERLRPYNPLSFSADSGVNLSLYDASKKWEIPQDMLAIKHPIIGYVGALNSSRLDLELIYRIAIDRPDYRFVMVGPEDDAFAQHQIHQLPNVTFLGKKPVDQLPAYINSFDVCLNIQLINEITKVNYPLKIDEYLAMGKPTVATTTQTMRTIFSEQVHLPSNKEEYLVAIDQALTEVDDDHLRLQRIAFAKTHSWENIVDRVYSYIQEAEKAR
ncbi:glycosyltransferase [Parabacteroides sp. OttesenSCG-928-N08]|nr:glycosyltransferase [Parabacteroides sp. OttesenSCG-928-N08]